MTQSSATSDTRSAVDKAFSLIRCFNPEDTAGVGVSELARRAHLSKSTAHRLLATLVSNGAVQRGGDVYRLGPLFFELTSEAASKRGEHVAEVLTPFLAALFERTRATVHLAYMEGTDVLYANKLFSVRGVNAPSRIGGRVPGFCTGVGKAMMAWDSFLVDQAIERGLPRWTPGTITDPTELRRTLACVGDEGVAYDREEITQGLHCVAAPVFGLGNEAVAAMSVSGPVGSFTPEDHVAILKKITQAATKAYIAAEKKGFVR